MEALKKVLSVPIADPTRKEINEAKLQKKVFELLEPIREKVVDDLEDLADRYRFHGRRLNIVKSKFPNEVYRGEKEGKFGELRFSNIGERESINGESLQVDLNLYWSLVEDNALKLRMTAEGYGVDTADKNKSLEIILPFSEDSLKQYKAVEDWLSALFYVKGFTKVRTQDLPMKRMAKEFQALKITPEEWNDFILRAYHAEFFQILESDLEDAERQRKNGEEIDAGFVNDNLAKLMKVKDPIEAAKKAISYHKKEFEKYKAKTTRFDKGDANGLMWKLLDEAGNTFTDWTFNHDIGSPPDEMLPYPDILKTEALPEPAAAGVAESAKTDEILVFDKDGQYRVGIRNKGEWDMFQMSPDGKNKYQGTGFQLKPPAGSEKVDWKSLPEQMQKAIKERKSKAVSALEKITAMSVLKKILTADKE